MDKDTAIRKAKAALRRAVDQSATPAERETALRQAKALLASAGADEVDVRASDIGESVTQLDVCQRPAAWVAMLVSAVADAFACRAYLRSSIFLGNAEVTYCGYAPWHELAAYAFEQLHRQGKRARKSYYDGLSKRRKQKTRTAEANAYAEGWVRTVYHRVLAPMEGQREQAAEDAEALDRYMNAKDLAEGKAGRSVGDKEKYRGAAYQGARDGRDAVLRQGVGVGRKSRALEQLS